MTTFSFWLISSYGLTGNSVGGIVFGTLLFIGVSIWLYQKTDQKLWDHIQNNWSYVLTAEILFTLLFFTWAWVRAQNPQITGTEKPMEFAFLNAVTNSPTYPPLDPWLSGFAISYYYMGYIMMSIVGRLAAVPMSITFNLTVAWLVAGSGIGAFGLVYNMTVLLTKEKEKITAAVRRNAVILGLIAAIAIPLAGNNQMMLEILHGNGIGSDGFWAWLDVRDIDGPANEQPRYKNSNGSLNGSWWWWRSSRVIEEYNLSGSGGLEPIAEFPGFSFVLGDIHPHVLAMPYIFLIIGLALTWYLDDRKWEEPESEGIVPWLQSLAKNLGLEKMIVAAILLGGLAFTNTWDLPIHLFVVMSALALNRWGQLGRFDSQVLAEVIATAIGTIALILVIYYPFFTGLNSQAGAPYIMPMLVQPTRMAHMLIIFGTPIFVIMCLLVVLGRKQVGSGKIGPAIAVGVGLPIFLLVLSLLLAMVIAGSEVGQGFYGGIINELGLALPPRTGPVDLGWGAAFVASLLPTYLGMRFTYLGVTVLLGFILGAVVWLWTGQLEKPLQSSADRNLLPFLLLMIFTGTLLVIGPEYLYLKDNFLQRINTVFKFYYQAWILLGCGALVALGYLLKHAKTTGYVAAGVYTVLFVFAIQFPIVGAQTRGIEFRGPTSSENRREATLDGLVFMQIHNQNDYEALQWLKQEADPQATVLEATGGAYSYYSRISANSGLPTLLGWANHERQWRGDSTDQVGIRVNEIQEIYNTRDWDRASQLLNNYDVSYIYVGDLERSDYDPRGLEKFENNLEVAFANEGVTIYRWK